MTAKTLTFNEISGLYRFLSGLSSEASKTLRQEAREIANDIATVAASTAKSQGGLAALVAPTLSGKTDRIPTVRMGGSKKLPAEGTGWKHGRKGPNQTIGDVIWGAEFGGARGTQSNRRTTQFRPWLGNGDTAGYFLYPTVREMSDEMQERYGEAVVRAIDTTAKTKGKAKRGR